MSEQKKQESVWGLEILEKLQMRRLSLVTELQKKQSQLQAHQNIIDQLSNEIVSMSGNISEVDYMLNMKKGDGIPDANTSPVSD